MKMTSFRLGFKILIIFHLVLGSIAKAEATPTPSPEPSSVQVWSELGQRQKIQKLSKRLKIEIAGYTIVNEFDGEEVTEFMLTRYPGGCIHVPLPPSSSIIHVVMSPGKSTPSFYGKRVVVTGQIKEGTRIDAGFEMIADSVKEFPL